MKFHIEQPYAELYSTCFRESPSEISFGFLSLQGFVIPGAC